MHRCKRCLLPSSRPDTAFKSGVCSACLNFEKQAEIDWESRKCDLMHLLDQQKPNGSGFDCVVASSGGKDSHAQVLSLLDLGARPLIVTAATCFLTKLGRANIENLKRYAPTIEVTPNQSVRARLNYLGLLLVGDISWPEHVSIFTTPLRMAVSLGIPLVFYGENPQNQYGGPEGSAEARQMTQRWVTEYGGFLGLRPSDMARQEGISEKAMQEYAFPSPQQVKKVGCEAHFLGQYLGPWDSHKNAARAIAAGMAYELPFVGNWWAWENLDNAMTGIHDYMMLKKYGFGRACSQLSVDIRLGKISRIDAEMHLVGLEKQFPWLYAGVTIGDVFDRIGTTMNEFARIVGKFTNESI